MIFNHVILGTTIKKGEINMVNIAELRARNGRMSQKELAEKLDVSAASISQWENDPLSMSSKSIIKVCLFFGVTSDELLGIKQKQA